MNNMRCSVCGGKLLPSKDDKTMLMCENCNNLYDLNQYHKVTVELDDTSINEIEKERLIKNAYIHIENKQFNYAYKTLDKLEYEYPDETEIIKLRKYYFNSLKIYEKERELSRRKGDINWQIDNLLDDSGFWHPAYECISAYDLEKAFVLLDEAEEDRANCIKFRDKMWNLYIDVRTGNLKIAHGSSLEKFYKIHDIPIDRYQNFRKLFYNAEEMSKQEVLLKKKKEELDVAEEKWVDYLTKFLRKISSIGMIFLILATILFFNNASSKIILPIIILGALLIGFTILCVLLYNTESDILKKFKHQDKIEKKIEKQISKIEKRITDLNNGFADIEHDYQEITTNKLAEYYKKHKL